MTRKAAFIYLLATAAMVAGLFMLGVAAKQSGKRAMSHRTSLQPIIPQNSFDSLAMAITNTEGGLYVFILSRPAGKYTRLGTVKVKSAMWSGVAPKMLELSIEQAKKDFPGCNGLIFYSLDMNNADAVQLSGR